MAQGCSTTIISMIRWNQPSRLTLKISLWRGVLVMGGFGENGGVEAVRVWG